MRARSFAFVDGVTSDLCFEARGETLEELFAASADALLAATVGDPECVRATRTCPIALAEPDLELLLLRFLNELVYQRDAHLLLLRTGRLRVGSNGEARLEGELEGEPIDETRHALEADVKAATAYGLSVARSDGGFRATVTLDV